MKSYEFITEGNASGIDVASAIQNTPLVWQRWIKSLPQQLGQEFVEERPNPDQEDIAAYTKLRLINPQPVAVSIKQLLQNPENQGCISRAPDDVIDEVNKIWGTKITSTEKFDARPGRHRENATLSGDSAAPSVMNNGEIMFGVGRFVSACLRADKTMKVWELRG